MIHLIDIIVGIVTTPFWVVWLWYMVRHSAEWARFVDRFHANLLSTGWFSSQYLSFLNPLEKGIALQVLAAVGVVLGIALVITPFVAN